MANMVLQNKAARRVAAAMYGRLMVLYQPVAWFEPRS